MVTNHVINRVEIAHLSLSDIIALHKLKCDYFNFESEEGSIYNEMWIVIDEELCKRINKIFIPDL